MRVLDVVGIVILLVLIAVMVLAAMATEAGVWAIAPDDKVTFAVPMLASGTGGSDWMQLVWFHDDSRSM